MSYKDRKIAENVPFTWLFFDVRNIVNETSRSGWLNCTALYLAAFSETCIHPNRSPYLGLEYLDMELAPVKVVALQTFKYSVTTQ